MCGIYNQNFVWDLKISWEPGSQVPRDSSTLYVGQSQNCPNKYQTKQCPVCRDEKSMDTQDHILVCAERNYNKKQVTQALPRYEDLFGVDVLKQMAVAKIIFEN